MWRKIGLGAAKLLAGIVAATAAVDLLFVVISRTPLRWVLPVPPVALYGPDPDTGYRHRANVSGLWLTEHRSLITISNLGLRDRNRNVDHDGALRAVVIGDSFIEALQVDGSETAVAVAEQILSRDHPGTEVVNLGLAGARPAVEVARLQSEGRRLSANAAVVTLYVDNLLSPTTRDDSEFTGYRRDGSGEYRLSYGFRGSSGYRFRTSLAGRIYYWLLDHSQVARIINARKNSGVLADWSDAAAAPAQRTQPSWSCASSLVDDQLALWRDGTPSEAHALATAFIRDLAAIRQSRDIPIIVAAWNIEARCPSLAAKRSALIEAMRARIERAGLQFLDLDQRIVEKVGPAGVAKLHGFGASFGTGHLNVEGNRVYGEIFADVLRPALFAQP
ncbi:MAG: hypothetical protein QOD29_4724 [Alphaproteobacteria bacterium]|nr:hypothetical protein [Alphaproteobacteria bacterium]